MSEEKAEHTPGPWRWELNPKGKTIILVGGTPVFDKTVMDFARWGMNGAAPRFNSAIAGGQFNIMHSISEREDWREPFPDRHHHASWCQSVKHPDAALIAAAPDLRASLAEMLNDAEGESILSPLEFESMRMRARLALAKSDVKTLEPIL